MAAPARSPSNGDDSPASRGVGLRHLHLRPLSRVARACHARHSAVVRVVRADPLCRRQGRRRASSWHGACAGHDSGRRGTRPSASRYGILVRCQMDWRRPRANARAGGRAGASRRHVAAVDAARHVDRRRRGRLAGGVVGGQRPQRRRRDRRHGRRRRRVGGRRRRHGDPGDGVVDGGARDRAGRHRSRDSPRSSEAATRRTASRLVIVGALATLIAMSGELGRLFVQASAYGDEERHPLRPPLGFAIAAVLAWVVWASALVDRAAAARGAGVDTRCDRHRSRRRRHGDAASPLAPAVAPMARAGAGRARPPRPDRARRDADAATVGGRADPSRPRRHRRRRSHGTATGNAIEVGTASSR